MQEDLTAIIRRVLIGYLKGTFQLMLLYGIAGFAIAWLLSLLHPSFRHYAPWLGVGGGILYGMPIVGGTLVAISFAITAALSGGLLFGLGAAVAVVALNLTFDYLVFPKVMGGHTGLHPLVALIAVIVGGAVAGPIGMILAVPVAAVAKEILAARQPKP